MSAKIKCDGCGKEVAMSQSNGNWFKPRSWFERSDKDGIQSACSRPCVEKIAEKSGKTSIVLPI